MKNKKLSIAVAVMSMCYHIATGVGKDTVFISGRKAGENVARSFVEKAKRFAYRKPKPTKTIDLVDQLYLDLYAGKRIAIPERYLNSPRTVKFTKATFHATPLTAALFGGHVHVVDYLLQQGADPDGANRDGLTPLHLTARAGALVLTKKLLDNGADPNKVDKAGMTPLMYAVLKNTNADHAAVIKLLLDNGADRLTVNNKGESALTFARAKHDEETIQLLLKKPLLESTEVHNPLLECPFGLPR